MTTKVTANELADTLDLSGKTVTLSPASKATDGFGLAANFGETEIYTVARFWKVA